MGGTLARKKVLIIDDFEESSEILKEHLELSGFNVQVACDGESGISVADRFRPDLILLDIMLPRMDGWEVMEKLRNKNASTIQIPVILMTAYVSLQEDNDRKRAADMGACGFLKKPFGLNDLLTKVQTNCR